MDSTARRMSVRLNTEGKVTNGKLPPLKMRPLAVTVGGAGEGAGAEAGAEAEGGGAEEGAEVGDGTPVIRISNRAGLSSTRLVPTAPLTPRLRSKIRPRILTELLQRWLQRMPEEKTGNRATPSSSTLPKTLTKVDVMRNLRRMTKVRVAGFHGSARGRPPLSPPRPANHFSL